MAHSLKITAQRSPSQEALALPTSCQLPFMLIFLSSTSHLLIQYAFYIFMNWQILLAFKRGLRESRSFCLFCFSLQLYPCHLWQRLEHHKQPSECTEGPRRGTNEKDHTGAQRVVLWFWSGSTRGTVCFTHYRFFTLHTLHVHTHHIIT